MEMVFPEAFDGFYFRFRDVWLELGLRGRRLGTAEGNELRRRAFGEGPVRFGISFFDRSPPESFSASADVLLRRRLADLPGYPAGLFAPPLGSEEEFRLVVSTYLAVRLQEVLRIVKDLERFLPAEALRQDRWRLNKALNLTGQMRLEGMPEEFQETVRDAVSRRFGLHARVVPQPVSIGTVCEEIGLSLDRLWSVAAPAGRTVDAARVHADLRALAASAAGPWVRLGFFFLVLDHFTSSFGAKGGDG